MLNIRLMTTGDDYSMQTLYYDGEILTMNDKQPIASAVLIEKDRIKKVGDYSQLKKIANSTVKEISLNGKTLMPSFIDPHGHILMAGIMGTMADLSECNNFDDIVNTLKAYIVKKELGPEEMVVGFGYDHNNLIEMDHPTRDVLNRASKTNPIFILHASVHMGAANDRALNFANVQEDIQDPEDGRYGRDSVTNRLTGYVEEGAMAHLQKLMSERYHVNLKEAILVAQKQYLKYGITTAQEGAATFENVEFYKELAEDNELLIDIVAYPTFEANPVKIIEKYKQYTKSYSNGFKIGGFKMFLDGSPQGKTAWLTKPYEGEETYRGYPNLPDNQVRENISLAIENDMQLLTHCNGDAASDQLINNYKEILDISDNPNKNELRPVMIHCQTVRKDQLIFMKKLHMIPSFFVSHTYYWGDVHIKNLGKERGSNISPVKSALNNELCVNFHTDTPVVKPDILHTIWCSVNRVTKNGLTIGEEEKIDVYDALKAVTINAAYAYFEEDVKGSIEEGKVADMVILDQNPLQVEKMSIKDIEVLATIKSGNVVYQGRE